MGDSWSLMSAWCGSQEHCSMSAYSYGGMDTNNLLLNQSLLIHLSRLKQSAGIDDTLKNTVTVLLL